MIYVSKSDPSVTVDAVEIRQAITFTGPGPFPVGHQIGTRGDFFVTYPDGTQKILHAREFEDFAPPSATEPEAAPYAAVETEQVEG